MGKFHEDINEVMPTVRQRNAAIKRASDEARSEVEVALNALDNAKRQFAFLNADTMYEDCGMAMAMVEGLRNSMEDQ